jgi:hypothetical protein
MKNELQRRIFSTFLVIHQQRRKAVDDDLLVEGLGVGGGGRNVGIAGSLVRAGGELELVGSLEVGVAGLAVGAGVVLEQTISKRYQYWLSAKHGLSAKDTNVGVNCDVEYYKRNGKKDGSRFSVTSRSKSLQIISVVTSRRDRGFYLPGMPLRIGFTGPLCGDRLEKSSSSPCFPVWSKEFFGGRSLQIMHDSEILAAILTWSITWCRNGGGPARFKLQVLARQLHRNNYEVTLLHILPFLHILPLCRNPTSSVIWSK